MLFLLISLSASFSRWPMSTEQYGVTITTTTGNLRWDFTGQDVKSRTYHDAFPIQNFTIFAKAFEPLKQSDLPIWQDITTYGMNVVRCGWIRGLERCLNLANIYDFEWTPKDDDNLQRGLLWQSDGEPNYMGDDTYEDWEFEFEFECEPGEDLHPDPQFQFDPVENEFKLIAKFSHQMGCPVSTQSRATPTPGPFAPACIASFRRTGQTNFGVEIDFKNLNNGRFGHGQTLFLPGGPGSTPYYLLFAPCERMVACPWGATCNTKNLTSAWLCSFNNNVQSEALTNCTAYGVVSDKGPSYALITADDVHSGVYYELQAQGGHNSRVHVQCDDLIPEGHIVFDPWQTTFTSDRSVVHLYIRTRDACARPIPTPAPLHGLCDLNMWDDNRNWELDLNLSKYTDKAKPYNQSVSWSQGFGPGIPYDLIYLPCDGLHCPAGYDCGGDEDAFIWLCEKWEPFHTPVCQAYGLHRYNLTMRPIADYMFAGVNVYYTGHSHKQAHVQFKCDESLAANLLKIDDAIRIEENLLYFHTHARLACPQGRGAKPTPPFRPIPKKPVKPDPTPTAIASPNPHRIVLNDTHVTIIDFLSMQQSVPSRAVQEIEYPQGTFSYWGTSHTQWWSWNPTYCPPGYVCPAGNWSNFWVCWFDEAFESYCHPVALKYVPGSRVQVRQAEHLDSGVYIRYQGVYKTHLELNVSCIPWGAPNTIPFAESIGFYTYDAATQEAEWRFDAAASYVCPHRLEAGHIPTAVRSPVPNGTIVEQSQIGDFINGSHIGINLKKFSYLQGQSIVGYDVHYHWAEWHYSPWDLIECPADHNCGVYQNESANLWKCVGQNQSSLNNCFPLGDRRYNLTVDFLNRTNELAGIKAVYGGGAPSYTVEVHWQCNSSVAYGTVYFNHFVPENASHHITLWAHTHEVCPDQEWGQIRGGAIFLLIVGVLFFAYFVLGTLIKYVITGSVSFLNDGFWSEVSDSLTTAVVFLVTCGRGSSGGGGGGGSIGSSTYNDI